MPNLRLFCGLITFPWFSWSVTLTAIVWMIRIGFVILAVVPFTRHFAMLGRRLARRMLSALSSCAEMCAHIGVLRLLRRLLEQTIDTHHRRRHFAIEAAVDADQIVRLYVLFVKRGGRNNGGDGAAFIAKLITVMSWRVSRLPRSETVAPSCMVFACSTVMIRPSSTPR
jgi:hypothetical protein